MASNKWQEPTLGWLAATPDPIRNKELLRLSKIAEAKAAYDYLTGTTGKGNLSADQLLSWYDNFKKTTPSNLNILRYQAGSMSGVSQVKGAVNTKNPYANATLEKIIQDGKAPWQNIQVTPATIPLFGTNVVNNFAAPVATPVGVQPTATEIALFNKTVARNGFAEASRALDNSIAIRTNPAYSWLLGGSRFQNNIASMVAAAARKPQAKPAALNKAQTDILGGKPVAGMTETEARFLDLILDRVVNEYKGSVNDYYTLNKQVMQALGLSDHTVGKKNIVTSAGLLNPKENMLYNPAFYDDPNLFRFFDAPSYNARNSGKFIYSDEANQWGGMDYADEAAAAIFKRYGLTPDKLTEKYGQFQGMSATDSPLIYQVQLSDGRSAFYTPYDFAIHGSVGSDNKTNYTPAKSLDWWLNNATPVSLGSSFKTPTSNNSLGLKTYTPTIGFLSSVNPLDMDDADFKKFIKEYKLGNTGGEHTSIKNGLYAGQSSIRQSYKDGPGFFQKALGVAAGFAIPFGLSALGAGPLFSKVLGSAIGGSLSGLTPDAIAKGAVTAGLGAAASDFVKGQQWFGTTNAAGQFLPYSDSAINAIGGSQLSQLANLTTTKGTERLVEAGVNRATDTSQKPQTLNVPSAPNSPSSSSASAAPSATGGGTGTQASPPPQPTFSNSVTGSQQQPSRPQVGFASSDPSLFNRSRRWGGSWGQSVPV